MGNENSADFKSHSNASGSYAHQHSNVRCHRCGEVGHIERNCDIVMVPRVQGTSRILEEDKKKRECEHCRGNHSSSTCIIHMKRMLEEERRKNLEDEKKKRELEKKVEKLEGQIEKVIKLNEEEQKKNAEKVAVNSGPQMKDAVSTDSGNNSTFKSHPPSYNQAINTNNPVNPDGPHPGQFNRPMPPPNQFPPQQPPNVPPFNQNFGNFPNPWSAQMRPPLLNSPPFPNMNPSQFNNQPGPPNNQQQNQRFYNQQPQPFPNNQNYQPQFNKNDNCNPETSSEHSNVNRQYPNNQFNQNRNGQDFNRRPRGQDRGGFNRGGNRGGRNNNDRNNYNNNNNNNNRGNFNRGGGREKPLFTGGKQNQSKPDSTVETTSDNEGNQNEGKTTDVNERRQNRNHRGVLRGGIQKERVMPKGKVQQRKQGTNKMESSSNGDSDSTSTGYETAVNNAEHKRHKSRNGRRKKEASAANSNPSTEGSKSDKKAESIVEKKKDEDIEECGKPLSKNNLGKGDILMKYIGTKLPTLRDALLFGDVSLYQKVEGVMLMSDPQSDAPTLQIAKNLLHIIEFKDEYPNAKSFFC